MADYATHFNAARHRTPLRMLLFNALQLAGFTSCAIAIPLFDLVGRHPSFFSSKDSRARDVIAFTLIVAVVPPALLILFEVVSFAAFRMRGVELAHGVLLLVLSVLISLPVAKRIRLPDSATILVALLFAVLLTVGVLYVRLVSRVAALGSIGILMSIGFLLFVSPASDLLHADLSPIGSKLAFARTPPVIVLRADELPLSSLITPDGGLDAARFPHFARFANESTWYRNTTTVNDETRFAVPAMFTGRIPPSWAAQIPAHHPRSVFTALGDVYEFAGETDGICPATICDDEADATAEASPHESVTPRLLMDASILYGHLVGTSAIERQLLPAWVLGVGNDLRVPTTDGARATVPDARWVEPAKHVSMIRQSDQPLFDLISVILPHRPFTLLPTGQTHSEHDWHIPGLDPDVGWLLEPQAVRTSYLAHLAQAGAVDTLLGQLIDRLRREDLYEDALIVVISDHGIAFTPGYHPRGELADAILADLAAVPFIVKYPGQTRGVVDDRPVEVTDLLPTIFGVLGVDPGWSMDGFDLRGELRRDERTIGSWTGPRRTLPDDMPERLRRSAARKYAFLNLEVVPDDAMETFYSSGPHRDLIGREVRHFQHRGRSSLRFTLEDAESYETVDLSGPVLPSAVTAFASELPARGEVAVSVNGRIASVTEVVEWEGRARIDALFWPGFLKNGDNDVALYELERTVLRRIRLDHR